MVVTHRPGDGVPVKISNLDPELPPDELQEIFKEIGGISGVMISYDERGRPSGEATIIFRTLADATRAVNEFHNVSTPAQVDCMRGTNSLVFVLSYLSVTHPTPNFI
jgi:RNA recognition motif-containing protein